MNRNIKHCRKVGLSRKKNTPSKTIESLLNTTENIIADTSNISEIQSNKTTTPKQTAKYEVNNDTPCRQVGLSRKRKISNPFSHFEMNKNVSPQSPSNNRINKRNSCKLKENTHNRHIEVPRSQSPDKNKIVEKNDKIVMGSRSNGDNNISCAKKLSNLYSIPSNDKMKKDEANIWQDTQFCIKNRITENDQEEFVSTVNMSSKSGADNNTNTIVENENSTEYSPNSIDDMEAGQQEILLENNIQKLNHSNCSDNNIEHSSGMIVRNDEDSNTISKNNGRFIKVSYLDKNDNEKLRSKVLKPKKQLFSSKLFNDDNDFEIGPKQKKQKKVFERSKTDIIKKEKVASTIKLKKSLSVGHPMSRTLTDNSNASNTSSLNLFTDCFVKLDRRTESIRPQNLCLTPQDQSDDEFETISYTPKEAKIINLDSLEKEVEEKRQMLEELKRAKTYKSMHNIQDLKELTLRWKTGCLGALQDLLKQLNMHSQITMEMLLKKLNIPEDFVLLSQ